MIGLTIAKKSALLTEYRLKTFTKIKLITQNAYWEQLPSPVNTAGRANTIDVPKGPAMLKLPKQKVLPNQHEDPASPNLSNQKRQPNLL